MEESDNDFHTRHGAHAKCAKLEKTGDCVSSLYTNLPSKEATIPSNVRSATIGTFEDVTHVVAIQLTEHGRGNLSDLVRGDSVEHVQLSKARGTTLSKARDVMLFALEHSLGCCLATAHALKDGNDGFESHRPMHTSSSAQRVGAIQRFAEDLNKCTSQQLRYLRNSLELYVKSDRDRNKYQLARARLPRLSSNSHEILSDADEEAMRVVESKLTKLGEPVGAIQRLAEDLNKCTSDQLLHLRNSLELYVKSDRGRNKYWLARARSPRLSSNSYRILSDADEEAMRVVESKLPKSEPVGAIQRLAEDLNKCTSQQLRRLRNSLELYVKSDRDRNKYRLARARSPGSFYAILSDADEEAMGTFGSELANEIVRREKEAAAAKKAEQKKKEAAEAAAAAEQKKKEAAEAAAAAEQKQNEVAKMALSDPFAVMAIAMNIPGWKIKSNQGFMFTSPDGSYTTKNPKEAQRVHAEKYT